MRFPGLWVVWVCVVVALIPCCALRGEEGLLVHYAFDQRSGNVLHDSSGNGHDGTIIGGASWVEGLPFGALSFNGEDAFVEGTQVFQPHLPRILHFVPRLYADQGKLAVENIQAQSEKKLSFANPRNGWIFMSCDATLHGSQTLSINADGAPEDTHPYMDPRYRLPAYTEAIRRIAAAPQFKNRTLYAWCGGLDRALTPQAKEFVETTLSAGGRIAEEHYLAELLTEQAGHDPLYGEVRSEIDHATAHFPGLVENLIFAPGIMSAIPESENVDPRVDYKVWMDMQMRYLATAPEFFGLAGIMWYKVAYADEEADGVPGGTIGQEVMCNFIEVQPYFE